MEADALLMAASVLTAAGLLGWWAAHRWGLPLVPILLLTGALFAGFGMPSPVERARPGLVALLQLGLIVVFFEGGRSLQRARLDGVLHETRHLAALGPKLGWVLGACGAVAILGVPWQTGFLVGAVLMVAAPYAVEGLHRRLGGSEPIAQVLAWETFLLSCLGAAWTVLVVGAIFAHSEHPNLLQTVAFTAQVAACGGGLGYGAARLVAFLRPRLSEDLVGPVSFATALVAFAVAQWLVFGSGLLAAGVAGYLLAAARQDLPADPFARDMRTLLLALLGVAMGLVVPLGEALEEWPRRLFFALYMVLGVRPLLVALACRKSPLPFREKLILALVAPRGALTLAVALTATLALQRHGVVLPADLAGIAWWVVMVSNLLPWLAAPLVQKVDRARAAATTASSSAPGPPTVTSRTPESSTVA